MKKNLPIKKQESKVVLAKSKSLISIANKILLHKGNVPQKHIDQWIAEIWSWADIFNISESKIPREKNALLALTELDFSNMGLKKFPSKLCFLKNITSLILSQNKLLELPKEIVNFNTLEILILTFNQITLTSDQKIWLGDLKSKGCLILVDPNWINMEELSSNIIQKENSNSEDAWMQRLWDWADEKDISDLQWVEDAFVEGDGEWIGLPRNKESLVTLAELRIINDDSLTNLPDEIGRLTNLIKLYIVNKQLIKLPNTIGDLKNLTELIVWGNQLKELPEDMGNLVNLENLNLGANNLKKLPKKIENLSNLARLHLEDNPNLTLTQAQIEWIYRLKSNGCNVTLNESLSKRDNIHSQDLNNLDQSMIKRGEESQDLVQNQSTNLIDKDILEDQESKVWLDEKTGLMWEIDQKYHKYVWSTDYIEKAFAPKELTDDVKDIFSYEKKLNSHNYGGFSDWRVPSFGELTTILIDEEQDNGFYLKKPLSENASFYYWSSTTNDDTPSKAWVFNFYDGGVSIDEKEAEMAIMCVRGKMSNEKDINDFTFI